MTDMTDNYEISISSNAKLFSLKKIEPLNPRNVSSEYWNATHENRAKLNEVIEKVNLIIDYLNQGVGK
jgi:hypothetical protein